MVLLEERGVARSHEDFKDVFGMTTKGAYFAFVRASSFCALCREERTDPSAICSKVVR